MKVNWAPLRTALFFTGLAAIAGCGGDGRPGSGVGGDGDGDFSDQDAGPQVGPVIEITSPAAASDPVDDEVIVGDSVEVTCKVTQRDTGGPVDPTSVKMEIFVADNSVAVASEPGVLMGADTFTATLPLDTVPGGPIAIVCSAKELGPEEISGARTLRTLYDRGPKIEFVNLTEESVVARGEDDKVDLSVQFKVTPSKLADDDPEADVSKVVLKINNKEEEAELSKGVYSLDIDFNERFGNAEVESISVAVEATNKRSKTRATSSSSLTVGVDGEGPVITITAPAKVGGQAPIVGGQIDVILEVTDVGAGLATGKDKFYAQVTNNGKINTYDDIKDLGSNSYTFSMQSSTFVDVASIELVIHAEDKAGNSSSVASPLRLDTVPPWVSLDPPIVREISISGMDAKCSGVFDPIGASPADGDPIPQASIMRALVWERGIDIEGSTVTWLSGVDEKVEGVKLYAQDNPDIPLIIDADGDGTCDSVNTTPEEGPAHNPVVFALSPAPAGGTVRKAEPELSTSPQSPEPPIECEPETAEDKEKCNRTEMSYVMKHTASSGPSVVYAESPAGDDCTGVSIDLQTTPGWVCVVASAKDNAGNLGVSLPHRLCRNSAACAGDPPPASLTCTSGCKIPTVWKTPTMPEIIYRE